MKYSTIEVIVIGVFYVLFFWLGTILGPKLFGRDYYEQLREERPQDRILFHGDSLTIDSDSEIWQYESDSISIYIEIKK